MKMGWKRTVLADYDQKGIADGATIENIKLPQAVISAIYLRLNGTGGSGTPAVDDLIATMKVKTGNGYVTDLRSADAHAIAKKKCGTHPKVTNATGAYTETNHALYFGRKPRDRTLMLDLRGSNVRTLELTYGTLIATTAWATGTVKLSVTIEEWVGTMPSEYKGFLSEKEVEDKATGTGKAVFDLFQGNKLAGILITISAITTVRQVTVSDKKESVTFGKVNFHDLLNIDNSESDKDSVETLIAHWQFYDENPDFPELPDLSKVSDPIVALERGTTTTTSRVVQQDLVR
jgi:hypothetical protein